MDKAEQLARTLKAYGLVGTIEEATRLASEILAKAPKPDPLPTLDEISSIKKQDAHEKKEPAEPVLMELVDEDAESIYKSSEDEK